MDRLMEKLPLLGIIAFLLLSLVFIQLRANKRDRQPEYTEKARLIKKNLGVDQIGGRYITENRHIDELIFETESGEVVKVRAARFASEKIPVAAEGILTWQGDRLCGFEQEERP